MNFIQNNHIIFLLLLISFQIQIILSSFLTSGVNTFNDFIYLQRIKDFVKQNKSSSCSLSDGPYCFQTDNLYYTNNYNKIYSNNNYSIEKEWYNFKNNSTSIPELFTNINTKIFNYLTHHLNSKEISKTEPIFDFETSLTFNAYDSLTNKKDILIDSQIFITFLGNDIPLFLEGKLILKHDHQKIIIKGNMDYPSNTYLIIESHYLKITMNKKYFQCKSFFIRPHNKNPEQNIKIIGQLRKNIHIEGYDENRLVFSNSLDFFYSDIKNWHKINLPQGSFINKLVIPGGYEVDNFIFNIKGNYLYDIESQFYNHPTQKTIILVTDDDI